MNQDELLKRMLVIKDEIDKLIKDWEAPKVTWLEKAAAAGYDATILLNELHGRCPALIASIAPFADYYTLIYDKRGFVIGCRGITCVECWNQEAK